MKTFLRVVLFLVLALIALKLIPITLGLFCLLATGLLGFIALGISAVAALVGVVIALAALLAPIWVPVLLVIGVIALIKRNGPRRPTLSA